ncbi:uncharacterized protein KGF55_001189 [Candida pseudojiufengensis]|uniref:uncharacterized protein n=1 Tax=Candida pseudojiufengensis TaxID=497109 RepID=UPI00222443BB|nr:uncharacterized protein KGF55_001189 [Candida pseudojiufengensis]KAI5965826.1 hypothetical protein KGF55_001189 [Candida pseudojiufengensis]
MISNNFINSLKRSPPLLKSSLSFFSTTIPKFNNSITTELSSSSISSIPISYSDFIPTTEEHKKFITRKTEKPLFSRRTYLIDLYKYINDNNEILLFIHHNNLNKNENKKLRQDLNKIESKLTMLKNSIYKTYLRSSHEIDPALVGNNNKNKKNKRKSNNNSLNNLDSLFVGPTAIISIPKCEPSKVLQISKLIKSLNEKIIIIGAKIDQNSILNLKEIDEFKFLPNKETLQGQLIGLLTMMGGVGLVKTLETPSQMLYLTMKQRETDLDPNSKTEEENK